MCIDSLAKSLSIDRNDKTQCKQFAKVKYKEHNIQNMIEIVMVMFLSSDFDLG